MTQDRQQILMDLFDRARAISLDERQAWLEQECSGDEALLREVRDLLEKAEIHVETMMSDAPLPTKSSFAQGGPETQSEADRTIGPYTLIRTLGEGGFGVVYEAMQSRPLRRKVALKVIKPGMDSARVIARFEAERQALAMMDHPGIAKVFDGGQTPLGHPYFVMELVEGLPITQYCDEHQLSTTARLELFAQACDAVHHAHQKSIVHRDLKPSNILVSHDDRGPLVRIIDFGIAKALEQPLTESPEATHHGQIIGTPEYMSPEQAAPGAVDIDTRSDVYTLGVILYELLIGCRPFEAQSADFSELQRVIRHEDAPRPSTRISSLGEQAVAVVSCRSTNLPQLKVQLRRELDWIPLRALRKDRDERYRSAAEMADDIRNYLSGRPLIAGPESSAYRMKKYVRRHRTLVLAATVVAIILVASTITTTLALFRARADAKVAREAEADLEMVARFQAGMLEQIDAGAMGEAALQLVSDAVARDLQREGLTPDEADANMEAFHRELDRVNVMDLARSLLDDQILSRAGAAIDTQFPDEPKVESMLRQSLADIYAGLALFEQALPHQRKAQAIRSTTQSEESIERMQSDNQMAELLLKSGKYEEAETYYRKGLEAAEAHLGPDHEITLTHMHNLAMLLGDTGRFDEATEYLEAAAEGARRELGLGDILTLQSTTDLAYYLQQAGRDAEAEKYYELGVRASLEALGPDDPVTLGNQNNMAQYLFSKGKYAEAKPYFVDLLGAARTVLGENHPNTAIVQVNLGSVLTKLQEFDEAERHLNEALERQRNMLGDDHPDVLQTEALLISLAHMSGRLEDAEQRLLVLIPRYERLLGPQHPDTLATIHDLAQVLSTAGRHADAIPYLQRVADGYATQLGRDHRLTLRSFVSLGRTTAHAGDCENGIRLIREARDTVLASDRAPGMRDELSRALAVTLIDCSRAELDADEFTTARDMLVESYELMTGLDHDESSVAQTSVSRLVSLYERWNEAEPDAGHDSEAERWRDRSE